MDKKNTIIGVTLLAAAFAIAVFGPKQQPAPAPQPAQQVVDGQPGEPPLITAPDGTAVAPAQIQPLTPASPFREVTQVDAAQKVLTLRNDFVEVRLTPQGGAILNVALLKYPDTLDSKDPFEFNGKHFLPALALTNLPGADAFTLFDIERADAESVVFRATRPDGVVVRRSFRLLPDRDDYLIRHETSFTNPTTATREIGRFGINIGTVAPVSARDSGLYLNAGYFDTEARFINRNKFDPGFFERLFGSRTEPETKITRESNLIWASVKNQFFTGIATFDTPAVGIEAERVNFGLVPGERRPRVGVTSTALLAPLSLAPGETRVVGLDYFAGPKEYARLKDLGQRQDLVMQFQIYWIFGWAAFFSKLLLACLSFIHSLIPNYGWSIIILTALIKILFFPLTAIAARSSKRMTKLAPKFKEIQEKYKDNPQKMQRELVGLYQKYGVNPLGGCIPILIQIPIFFGLFGMLQSASELRFADWLWIRDLSMPDTIATVAGFPINIMPLIMSVTVIVQTRLMPTPPTADQFQMKLFKLLPIVFCIFSYFFASGLVLYWTVNNLFSIGQQWYINRQPEPELVEVAPGKKSGFAAKLAELQEKAEQARKLQEEQLRKKKGKKK